MKKSKIILGVAALIVLAVAGVIFYVLTNINTILESAIERYGSRAAGTRVRVSSVEVDLSEARAAINGMTVANPAGFSSPDAFRLQNISVRIDAGTAAKTPLVVDRISISGPQVFYEINESGVSNLDVLRKNLQGPQKPPKTESEKKAKEEEVRLYIKKLVFERGKIDVRIAARGDRVLTVNLPRIELSGIGRNGGATPREVGLIVVKALAEETAKAVAKTQGEKYLRKGAERLLERYLK